MKRNTGKLYWAAIPENNNKKRRFHTAAFTLWRCSSDWHKSAQGCIINIKKGVAGDGYPLRFLWKSNRDLGRLGGYFFIAIMVYRTIIRIKVMYSTASPPPKKEGAKSITPSGIKRGKTANRMATPVCILPDHSSGRNIRTEKRQDFLPLFVWFEAWTGPVQTQSYDGV